jgi:hypothetical protein
MPDNIRRQAGKRPEIALTPKMIQAATRVLNSSGIVEFPTTSDDEIVRLMLKVALRAGGFSVRTGQDDQLS